LKKIVLVFYAERNLVWRDRLIDFPMKEYQRFKLAVFDLDGTLTWEKSIWEYIHKQLDAKRMAQNA